MQLLETDYWSCCLPDEWQAKQEEENVIVIEADGVSTVAVTTMVRSSGVIDDKALLELAGDLVEAGYHGNAVLLGGFSGFLFDFSEEGVAWREWYLMHNDVVLIISHACEEEHCGLDDVAVDEFLGTLAPVEQHTDPS